MPKDEPLKNEQVEKVLSPHPLSFMRLQSLCIFLIVWGVAKLTQRNGSIKKRDPLEIAKERYARGDISREEFEQIKKDLS